MRGGRSSSLPKKPDSCQALLSFIQWWLVMFCLEEVMQVAARGSAVSNSVTFFSTDERCSFFIPPQKTPTAVKHFEFYWVMTSHVWLGRGHASCRQGFSCKQFGDFFSRQMRGVRSSSLHKTLRQLLSTFEFIDWWLVMFCLNELSQFTTRSSAASISAFFSTNERCSFFIP